MAFPAATYAFKPNGGGRVFEEKEEGRREDVSKRVKNARLSPLQVASVILKGGNSSQVGSLRRQVSFTHLQGCGTLYTWFLVLTA